MNRLTNLSPEQLSNLYAAFNRDRNPKTNRSLSDQRFGQAIWNLYGQSGASFPELFYAEVPEHAYALALQEIS